MVENSRKDPRAKVLSMTVRYKSATLDEFIEHHSNDVSRGGMYIKTPQPFPPGTLLKFEVKIGMDQKLMQGVGRVVWRRQSDEATELHPSGMGVKFIKLDEESKAMIGQLVNSRSSESSAFDEVTASSDRPPPSLSEPPMPPMQTAPAAKGNFFPTSDDGVAPPAPEDRTVMKQAAELLEEALREVGTSAAGSAPPTAKRDSDVSTSERKFSGKPGHISAGNLPAVKVPRAETASSGKSRVAGAADSSEPSTLPPARAAAATTVGASTRGLERAPAAEAATANKSRDSEARSRTAQPTGKEGKIAAGSRAGANASQAAATRELQKVATETGSNAAVQAQAGSPARKSSSGSGLRAVIMLVIVAGVAAFVFAISRKSAPPALIESAASASAPVAEPTPTPAPSPSPALTAAEIASTTPSAQPSASSSAPAAESATPPVAESATPVASQAPSESEPKTIPKPKSRVRAVAAPPKKKTSGETETPAAQPTEAPAETVAPPSGATETPKSNSDSTAPKGAGIPAPAPAPAPTHEENPL